MRGAAGVSVPLNIWSYCSPYPGGWGGCEIRCKELWGPLAVQSNPPTHPPHTKKEKTLGGTGTPLKLRKLLATLLIDGDSNLFLLIVVKVTRVPRAFKLWYEGSFHLERGQEPPRPQQST